MQQIRSRHQSAYTCPSHDPFSVSQSTDGRLPEVNARPYIPIKAVVMPHKITSKHSFGKKRYLEAIEAVVDKSRDLEPAEYFSGLCLGS